MRKKKMKDRYEALHDATHGQFGEEPRPEPFPDDNGSYEYDHNDGRAIEDKRKAARLKSRSVR